jgi:putative peptidoglycan lipid II flippase
MVPALDRNVGAIPSEELKPLPIGRRAMKSSSAAVPLNDNTGSLDDLAVDSRTVAVGILASRVTGFLRVAVTAAVLGPTYFGNLFQFCSILPGTLYSLLMGALMSALLVPPLVRRIPDRDKKAVRRFANAALGAMIVVLFGAGVLTILILPLLLGGVTYDVQDPMVRSRHLQLGILLASLQMPQAVLCGIIGAGIAVQQAHGRFALAAVAPAIENIGMVAVLITSAIMFGTGVDVAAVSRQQVMLLGLGTTAAVAIHAGVQWWGAYRLGVPLLPRPDGWRETEVRTMLRQGSRSIGYTGLYWSGFLLALVSAGAIPGGLVAFQMATNLCNFPVALTAMPLALAQLPRLSSNHHQNQLTEFRSTYWAGLRLVIFMALPASLILAVIPQTLARALAFGAMHTPIATVVLASCIGGLGIGVVGEAMFTLVTSSCYARNEKSTPFQAMLLRFAVIGTGVAIARVALAGPQLLWTLGAVVSAGNIIAAAYLHWRLQRALPDINFPSSIGLGELILAVVAVVPAVLLANWFGSDSDQATIFRTVLVAFMALFGSITAYLSLHFLRGSLELKLVFPSIEQVRFFGQISLLRPKDAASQPASEADPQPHETR